jgi:hypothetical protein
MHKLPQHQERPARVLPARGFRPFWLRVVKLRERRLAKRI